MIVSFSVENWMSFCERVTFTMVATRERQHGHRVPKIGKYSTRILPIAAVYGGNASGKTNFFKALHFVKSFVVRGTRPEALIPVEPFRLSPKGTNRPSRFVIELLMNEIIYEFSFAVTRKGIVEEKLVVIRSTNETVLYDRRDGKLTLDDSLINDPFLEFAFNGTRDNQLFLTNSVSQKVDTFKPVYNWFKNTLELIAPDARFESFEHFFDEGSPLYSPMNEVLLQLDTGISHLGGEEIPLANIPMPDQLKIDLQENIKEGMTFRIATELSNDRFIVTRKDDELIAKKLVSYHLNSDGTETKFEISQESDGSRRVLDLLPAVLDLSRQGSDKVYVIDEIDRSLHTLLTRQVLEVYLSSCSDTSRAQLLLTTHDVQLMDQHLLRRDEMWVTERNASGASSLLSFSAYKDVRYDKDIRKSYLQGRLGGIPHIVRAGFAPQISASPGK